MFRARTRARPDGPVVVLSPHPDDAALSCWSVLAGSGDVIVVNAFAGTPATHTPGDWDRHCGAVDAHDHAARRTAEDARALSLAGRRAVNLPFADWQYRRGEPPPSLRRIERALRTAVGAPALVYAPATTGHDHPDHLRMRALGMRLAAVGVPVRYYADLPYCAGPGWPERVASGRGEVVRLAPAEAARKREALGRYETQFAALAEAFPGVVDDPGVYACEVFWG